MLRFAFLAVIALFVFGSENGHAAKVNGRGCVDPKLIDHQPAPDPSRYALKEGATALVSFFVNEKGDVVDAEIRQSSGNSEYDGAVLDEVRN